MMLKIHIDRHLWCGRALLFLSVYDACVWARRTFVPGCLVTVVQDGYVASEFVIGAKQ